jgi:hypothetical protein
MLTLYNYVDSPIGMSIYAGYTNDELEVVGRAGIKVTVGKPYRRDH